MSADEQAGLASPDPSAAPDAGASPIAGTVPAADAAPAAEGTGGDPVAADPGDLALLALIDRLAGILERSDLTELEVQVGSTGLVLRKPAALATMAVVPEPSSTGVTGAGGAAAAAPAGPAGAGEGQGAPERPSVKAPLTGIWYGSPSPTSPAYVSVGGEVAAGQVIGLIEAMKLFNEIKSDLSGRVVKIHAENGTLVKARQPLIEVEPL